METKSYDSELFRDSPLFRFEGYVIEVVDGVRLLLLLHLCTVVRLTANLAWNVATILCSNRSFPLFIMYGLPIKPSLGFSVSCVIEWRIDGLWSIYRSRTSFSITICSRVNEIKHLIDIAIASELLVHRCIDFVWLLSFHSFARHHSSMRFKGVVWRLLSEGRLITKSIILFRWQLLFPLSISRLGRNRYDRSRVASVTQLCSLLLLNLLRFLHSLSKSFREYDICKI